MSDSKVLRSGTINRRQWLSSSLSMGSSVGIGGIASLSLLTGCNTESELTQSDDTSKDRQLELPQVPLRLLMVGAESDADLLKRGWAAVSDQPLHVTSIGNGDRGAIAQSKKIIRAAQKCDLLWFPRCLLAEMVDQGVIAPLRDESMRATLKKSFPAIRNGLSAYGGETYTLPLGAAIPTIMSLEPAAQPLTWAEYDRLVEEKWKRSAGEPSAKGWAAMMFLWRCVGNVERWLFDPNSFHPLVASSDYVDTLAQMTLTCQKYKQLDWTPAQINQQLAAGELAAGITYPHPSESESEFSGIVMPLPGQQKEVTKARRSVVLFDAMAPLVGMASACRQTAASKVFLNWIAGGEGSGSVRDHLAGVFDRGISNAATLSPGQAGASDYERVRRELLQRPIASEGLMILNPGAYYNSLDTEIRSCLTGKKTAAESLKEVASQWKKLTKNIGAENQLSAWRRAKGFRA